MKISLLCPTRKRPEWMGRLWNTARETAHDKTNIELIFYIDSDDDLSKNAFTYIQSSQINAVIGNHPVNLTDMYNKCWEVATGEIFTPINDDFIFESKDWDKYIRDSFMNYPDKILLVYGHSQPSRKFTSKAILPFIHKNWTNVIGRVSPPYFKFWYTDTWLTEIADNIDRKKFIPEVEIIHYHAAIYGEKTAEQRANLSREENRKIWGRTKAERIEEANKLIEFINNFNKD